MTTVPVFESWEDFRSKSEFFPAGRIVPKRIMDIRHRNGNRFKFHHRFIFGVDTWIYHASSGLKFIMPLGGQRELLPGEYTMHLALRPATTIGRIPGETDNIRMYGAPYATMNFFAARIPMISIEEANAIILESYK
jgi:hypothetical protein